VRFIRAYSLLGYALSRQLTRRPPDLDLAGHGGGDQGLAALYQQVDLGGSSRPEIVVMALREDQLVAISRCRRTSSLGSLSRLRSRMLMPLIVAPTIRASAWLCTECDLSANHNHVGSTCSVCAIMATS